MVAGEYTANGGRPEVMNLRLACATLLLRMDTNSYVPLKPSVAMKIAQVAPLFESVPPKAYGGTERVVSYLTEALVSQGHDVTLFACDDSVTKAHLVAGAKRGLRLDPARPDPVIRHVIMMDLVFDHASQFDVIHFHVDALHYPMARRCATPSLTTLHGRLDLPDIQILHNHFGEHPVVSISHHQRTTMRDANWLDTVHHGLPVDQYRFHPHPENYFAFLGRISPEKRVDRAIEIAIACGTPLRIAAKVDTYDERYFEDVIKPLLNHPLIEFMGEIAEAEKNDFLGGAKALLFPIDWPEPFGLVMIEALAAGTPVIAFDRGSVSEIVEDGVSGRIVVSTAEAIKAGREVGRISRRRCRDAFDLKFTSSIMATRYLSLYAKLTAGRSSVGGPVPRKIETSNRGRTG